MTKRRGCELCEGEAALYCAADEAHICWECDAKVHGANFLVARHTRAVLCGGCGMATAGKATGATPVPRAGVCAECAQGESQGECASRDEGSVVDAGRVEVRGVDSGYETGCSSSRGESGLGEVVEEESTVRAEPCESVSQLSGERVGGVTVDSRSVQASVSTGISKVLKRKRLDCCSPVAVPQSKQIATRALEDVNRSVSHRQCDCDSTASSSPSNQSNQRAAHASQDPSLETSFGFNNRAFGTLSLSSAKRQRMDDRTQMRPSLSRHQQLAALPSTARLMRMLAKWHWDLQLSSPGTVPLALRMYRKVSRALAPAVLSNSGVRVTLAACLRLAAGLDEAQITVPKASEVAACAGVSTRRLAMTEIHLLALLGWRRFPVWAGSRA
ncbi:hypothetical protein KC19_9G120300 [Ceratodon purpureus]|uniref:B box-type domain-containing protein n=1 Tax=Ceratodon purpureus TaxID=3225 RepID=A0A8T0GVF7_CERPU|nr:hypothetical protein KC19_9G120300 [Ceratodon purpureus]